MSLRNSALAVLFVLASSARGASYFDETAATTLFAFDSVSIPHSQNLRLEMRSPQRYAKNPVLSRGASGSPDAAGVQFYGSIHREGDRYRMWYVAYDDDVLQKVTAARWRPAYAESTDGFHWQKPELGLVDFHGRTANNLVQVDPPLGFVNLKVLPDASDPDPQRRYKMSAHVYFHHHSRLGTLAPYASADGLRWKLLKPAQAKRAELQEKDLFLPGVHFEPCGGLYRWDGLFYACGQNALNATRPYHGRVTRMYRSSDFLNWSTTSSVGFVRPEQHNLLGAGRSLEGEQTHEGISVWNRGNVLLGTVGLWHGAKEWKDITIDLGFVMSNDGVSFREPAAGWTFLRRGEDAAWDQGGLLQAQGFENIGEQTCIYYGAWDPRDRKTAPQPRGGVGIALLPRDRFGDLVVEEAGQGKGNYQQPVITSEFVTAAIPLVAGAEPKFFVNAAGLGAEASLKIELLNALEQPLGGYVANVRTSGFQTPVAWEGSGLGKLPERVRVRVTFEGLKRNEIRFSALYVLGAPGAGRQ